MTSSSVFGIMERGDTTEEKYVSQYTYEASMARMERIIKRLWVLAIIIFLALILTNGAWIYYESQFEVVEETTETVTQEVKTHGDSDAVVAGIGDAFNGGTDQADGEAYNKTLSQKEEVND